jgi:hypothetical protein
MRELLPGEVICRPGEDFWRHRQVCDYIIKDEKLMRASDGEVLARGPRLAEQLAKRLEKPGRHCPGKKVLRYG